MVLKRTVINSPLGFLICRFGYASYCGEGFGVLWWYTYSHDGRHGLDVHWIRRGHGHFLHHRVRHLPDLP